MEFSDYINLDENELNCRNKYCKALLETYGGKIICQLCCTHYKRTRKLRGKDKPIGNERKSISSKKNKKNFKSKKNGKVEKLSKDSNLHCDKETNSEIKENDESIENYHKEFIRKIPISSYPPITLDSFNSPLSLNFQQYPQKEWSLSNMDNFITDIENEFDLEPFDYFEKDMIYPLNDLVGNDANQLKEMDQNDSLNFINDPDTTINWED